MATDPARRQGPGRSVLGVGEAMIEFAAVGTDLYRRGFAGDTLNTCWHMARLLRAHARIGYCTAVGCDAFSEELVAFIASGGMEVGSIFRDPERALGLYVISLAGAERSFSYWRDASAARRLADDYPRLQAALRDRGLVHVSGITLAIVGEDGRRNLCRALREARASGTTVSFDPNLRQRLWRDPGELRRAMHEMLQVADIALPSFDDEATLWGDPDPEATVVRLQRAGVEEIVVKNGAGDVVCAVDGHLARSPTPRVADPVDTTGAGDAFNAGYLAGRLVGMDPIAACGLGQATAGEVIRHFGALAPAESLASLSAAIDRQVEAQ